MGKIAQNVRKGIVMSSALATLREEKFVAIMRGIPTEKIGEVAKASVAGGIKFVEITYDHKKEDPKAFFAEQIEAVKAAVGDTAYVGAGTVLTVDQVNWAYEHGAQYIVSPNTNDDVIRRTKELGLVSVPGAMSPSEIVHAYDLGADIVKLYIIEDPQYVKFLMGPLGHIPYQATCNVSIDTIPTWLAAGAKCFGTRAFITNDLIEKEDYAEITRRAAAHVKAIKENA